MPEAAAPHFARPCLNVSKTKSSERVTFLNLPSRALIILSSRPAQWHPRSVILGITKTTSRVYDIQMRFHLHQIHPSCSTFLTLGCRAANIQAQDSHHGW